MNKDFKFAAIDIGSNALRFAYTDQKSKIYGAKKMRIPLRLGQDVFQLNRVKEKNFKYCQFIFRELSQFIKNENIETLKVYATSALRDADNALDLIETISKESKINIEVIDGYKEAKLIQNLVEYEFSLKKRNYLLIDIGGGSLELNLYIQGKFTRSLSLDIGTVRMLNSKKSFEECLDDIKPSIKKFLGKELDKDIEILGTGGNFRQIMKIFRSEKSVETFSGKTIKKLSKDIFNLPLNKRIDDFNLNPDRAKVISPALYIINFFLSNIKASKVHCCRYSLVHAILLEIITEFEI